MSSKKKSKAKQKKERPKIGSKKEELKKLKAAYKAGTLKFNPEDIAKSILKDLRNQF